MVNPIPRQTSYPGTGPLQVELSRRDGEIARSINFVGWRDLVGNLTVKRAAGAGVPVFTQIGTTGFYAYKFLLNDEIQVVYHLDHDLAPRTELFFHTHYVKDGTNVQPIKWQFSIAYAHGHQRGVFPFASPTVTTVTQTPLSTAFTHQIAEISTGVDLSWEVDGLIVVNIKRITNGATDNTDGVFLLTADAHYKSDRTSTQNKAYPFY